MKTKLIFFLLSSIFLISCSKDNDEPIQNENNIKSSYKYLIKSIVKEDTNEEVLHCEYDKNGRLTYYKNIYPNQWRGEDGDWSKLNIIADNFIYDTNNISCKWSEKETFQNSGKIDHEIILPLYYGINANNQIINCYEGLIQYEYTNGNLSKIQVEDYDDNSKSNEIVYIWDNGNIVNDDTYYFFNDYKISSIINESNFDIIFYFMLIEAFNSGTYNFLALNGSIGNIGKNLVSETVGFGYSDFNIKATNNYKGYTESYTITSNTNFCNTYLLGKYKIEYYETHY